MRSDNALGLGSGLFVQELINGSIDQQTVQSTWRVVPNAGNQSISELDKEDRINDSLMSLALERDLGQRMILPADTLVSWHQLHHLMTSFVHKMFVRRQDELWKKAKRTSRR